MVFGYQTLAQRDLIRRRIVIHREDILPRPYISFRVAMAPEAPFHRERLGLPGERHFVDAAVAGLAANSFMDVNTVVEIDEIREIVDARPFDRSARAVALANRCERWTRGPHL